MRWQTLAGIFHIVPLGPASEGGPYPSKYKRGQRCCAPTRGTKPTTVRVGARLAGDWWHKRVIAAVVGLLAVNESAEDPEADVPNECVDEEIAGEGESDPEPGPALEQSALGVKRGDQMRPWPDQRSLNSSLPRVVSEMDFRFEQENRSSDSQDNGPEKF